MTVDELVNAVDELVNAVDGWRGEPGELQAKQEGAWSLVVYPDPDCWRFAAQIPHDGWYKSVSGWCYTQEAAKKAAVAIARGLA